MQTSYVKSEKMHLRSHPQQLEKADGILLTLCFVKFQLKLILLLGFQIELVQEVLVLFQKLGRVFFAFRELFLQRKMKIMSLLQLGKKIRSQQLLHKTANQEKSSQTCVHQSIFYLCISLIEEIQQCVYCVT